MCVWLAHCVLQLRQQPREELSDDLASQYGGRGNKKSTETQTGLERGEEGRGEGGGGGREEGEGEKKGRGRRRGGGEGEGDRRVLNRRGNKGE